MGDVAQWRNRRKAYQQHLWEEAKRASEWLKQAGALDVILFGSVARGEASFHSDIDLIAVMMGVEGAPMHRRLQDVILSLPIRTPLDVLVYSPEEWQEMSHKGVFGRTVAAEGVSLFGEGPGRTLTCHRQTLPQAAR